MLKELTERAANVITAVAVLAAIVVVGARLRTDVFAKDPDAPRKVKNWRSFQIGGLREGPANAAVTVVEFSDFQCPFCRRAASYLEDARKRYPNDLTVIYRNYPMHPYAGQAARLVECTADQGAFWRTHSLLFAKAESIGVKPWVDFARESGARDTASLMRCMADRTIAERVTRDSAAGVALEVTGTPTFLVNEIRIAGFGRDSTLQNLIESAIQKAHREPILR